MNPTADPVDAQGLDARFASLPTNELLAIVRAGSDGYEAEALAAAHAELEARGHDPEPASSAAREAKLRKTGLVLEGRETEDIPSWAYWVCLIEGSTTALLVLVWLWSSGRRSAGRQGIQAVVLGWFVKIALLWGFASLSKLRTS